jgi:hypothetical protein
MTWKINKSSYISLTIKGWYLKWDIQDIVINTRSHQYRSTNKIIPCGNGKGLKSLYIYINRWP